MKILDIRIRRQRTQEGLSVWELLESWAKMEGRTMPGAIEHLLRGNPIFMEYATKIRIDANRKYATKIRNDAKKAP